MIEEAVKIDCHVHWVGDGSDGSGCWLRRNTFLDHILEPLIKRQAGVFESSRLLGLDKAYKSKLLELVEGSRLDKLVLLAMDYPYDEEGKILKDRAKFYVPNQLVLELSNSNPQFIPACSIHPARKDAIDELEKCHLQGAKVLKLLPNYHNVNCSDSSYSKFWKKVASLGLLFLSHTGGELSVPIINAKYADPRVLHLPLELGVQVIAAHGAGRSALFDQDYTSDLLKMLNKYPNLFIDNSALASINRWPTIKHLLSPSVQKRVVHGSDFPIPSSGLGPFLGRLLSFSELLKSRKIKNSLERDCYIKQCVGFNESTFTRLSCLIS